MGAILTYYGFIADYIPIVLNFHPEILFWGWCTPTGHEDNGKGITSEAIVALKFSSPRSGARRRKRNHGRRIYFYHAGP